MAKTRVYILGAGCSYDQPGYPLAKQFVPELTAYAQKIGTDPARQRIKNAVEGTTSLLTHCKASATCYASTIDQLINLILDKRCDEQLRVLNPNPAWDIVALRYSAVRNAKIATSACFLEMEGAVLQRQIGKYREFIQRKILDETGHGEPCQTRLAKSSARVLSFNYDRLFELAFFGAFADPYLKQFSPYQAEALNSGINAFGDIAEPAKDRFCFLKLHGSVGMLCFEDRFRQGAQHIRNVADWKNEPVTDTLFFSQKPAPRFPIEPMIAFPYEKDYIVSGRSNELPFRSYIEKVWAHATAVLQGATEIWVIGYSFDPTDAKYLINLLCQAQECRRIVVQNLPAECERIAALLSTEYQINIPIEPYPVAF
jgi:hypothetical protein